MFFKASLMVDLNKRVETGKIQRCFQMLMLFPRIKKSVWQMIVIFPIFLESGIDFNADQSAVCLIMGSD